MTDPAATGRVMEKLGYEFKDQGLLEQALTHSSYAFEEQGENLAGPLSRHYERLEYLGDAVLDLVVSDLLIRRFPEAPEGVLSRLRAGLVNSDRLSGLARELGLCEALRLGRGEETTGGRDKSSILAAAYEAVFGAVYLDGGFGAAFAAAATAFIKLIDAMSMSELLGDFKTPFQERVQARFRSTPHYRVIAEHGPDHDKSFEIEVWVDGRPWARGAGKSKKEAEQEAARKAMEQGEWE